MIKSLVDDIIGSIKLHVNLRDVRFVREFGSNRSGKPLSGFLAVVRYSLPETSKSYIGGYCGNNIAGKTLNCNLRIRLYGGSDISGVELAEKAEQFDKALKSNDTDNLIDKISVSDSRYDSLTGDAFREIDCLMSFNIIEV
ncbi:MAG: hypothetical protein IIU14_05175 [Ruminococcus sp.]|nr:hypothetical protein [Ruminococcus sp.]